MDPAPPYFLIGLFPAMAISAAIVFRSITNGILRVRAARDAPRIAPAADPVVMAQMQAEIDDLRMQVERLSAAQHFYAQLQPAAPIAAALPGEAASPLA